MSKLVIVPLVGGLVVACAVFLFLRRTEEFTGSRREPSGVVVVPTTGGSVGTTIPLMDYARTDFSKIAAQISIAGANELQRAELHEAIAVALRVYFAGSRDDYAAFMRAQDLEPEDSVVAGSPNAWDSRVRMLRLAEPKFQSATASIAVSGSHDARLSSGSSFMRSNRENRGSGDVPVDESTPTALITIPLIVPDLRGGDRPSGELKFNVEFVRRAQDGKWILKRLALSDVPPGFLVNLPPN